ncbi:hypothetical protein Aoki45_21320 [Algoriphagus sp. oki45]|nr:hypothetical protein Aoki45_21320 [Algoriphagus sp. oki45]
MRTHQIFPKSRFFLTFFSLLFRYKFLTIILFGLSFSGFSQEKERLAILAQRQASNQALRDFDEKKNNTFMTEDALITTGTGTLISGKKKLTKYIQNLKGPKMYWVRSPDEVIINPETQLAWETGTWKGYVEGAEKPVVGGKYSAQWTKKSGTWLLQSQLFVALPSQK